MKLRTSFRGKLLLLTIVPLAVAQFVTLIAVMQTVEEDIDQRARESLIIGGQVVTKFLADRANQLRTSVEVVTADFGLKEAVATGDAETIASALENHSQRVSADVAFLTDLDGNPVGGTSTFGAVTTANISALIDNANPSLAVESTLVVGDHTYQVFSAALRAPLPVAWLVLGFRIDDQLAEQFSVLTGVAVTIASSEKFDSRAIARSGESGVSPGAEPGWIDPDADSYSIYIASTENDDSLSLNVPFSAADNRVIVTLQQSIRQAMMPYTDARGGLIAFSATLLVLMAVFAAYVAGGIARPVRLLTDAAREMIAGNYDATVKLTTDDEISQLATSFNAMRTAISEREERISHQALHDSLTDLPNRNNILLRMNDAIEFARQHDENLSVLSIRLSRMAAISSTLGHSASDEVIKLAARHLKVNLDPDEILGHVGTNEFVLILQKCDTDNALTYADRIQSILGSGVTLERVNINLQTEIGIAEFPRHGDDAAELLRNASIARNEAENGHERVVIYEEGRQDHYVRQLRIVNDLRSALKRNEVQLHFQPKISLPGGKVCGAEALVRWQHPELGLLAPDEFIPAAEEAGTIVHLTRYVLSRAVAYCREWTDKGHTLQVAVNLSARDLQDEYLPYYVLQLLKEHGIPATQLTLEITENTVMHNINHAVAVLECLRDIGVRVSIDDFGTGHSSLAQLRNIPLHELKVDKSFIMSMLGDDMNEAIVRAVIDLAHNMHLDVVAEGVEDEDTLRQLCGFGCEQAQGYFFSKPVTSDVFLNWLATYKPVEYRERRHKGRVFADSA